MMCKDAATAVGQHESQLTSPHITFTYYALVNQAKLDRIFLSSKLQVLASYISTGCPVTLQECA